VKAIIINTLLLHVSNVETAIQLGFRLRTIRQTALFESLGADLHCEVLSKTRSFAIDANRESCRRSKMVFS